MKFVVVLFTFIAIIAPCKANNYFLSEKFSNSFCYYVLAISAQCIGVGCAVVYKPQVGTEPPQFAGCYGMGCVSFNKPSVEKATPIKITTHKEPSARRCCIGAGCVGDEPSDSNENPVKARCCIGAGCVSRD